MASLFQSSLDRACRRLRNNDHTLQKLYLDNNQISDEGATALAHAIKGNTTFQRLSLRDNKISDEGATALAHALKGNTTLQILWLGGNQISDAGATALAHAMKRNTTLQRLWLGSNQISDEGATALADAMKGNTTLQRLSLRYNKISDEGVTALAHALKGNTTLQLLWLGSNQISDEGATALADAMKGNTTLQRLSLRYNKISDEGVTALAHALKGNKTLQILDLDNNQVSDEGVTALESLLDGNTKLSIYACGRLITASDKPKDTAAHDGEIAPFYDKLIKINKKDVNVATRLLGELSYFIDDVHEMKIYYTYVACYYRMSLIEKDDAGTFIKNGLLTVSTKCQDRYSVVMFKLINEKAYEDGYLTRWDFHDGDQLAEHAGLHPKFESLVEAIRTNMARIEGLEANLVAVNNSVNQIRKGLRRKYRIEAVTGFISAVINAISMGIGGGLVNAAAAFHTVIDFGDIDHLKENFADNAALLDQVNEGLALADEIVVTVGDKLSDSKLKNVVNNEKDVIIGLVVAAKLVHQPNWSGNLGVSPTHPPAVADGTAAEATIPESGAVEGDNMFADAELDEEEECGLPLHAAIKCGQKDYLKELLETMEHVDVNQLDSKERTAADFAALCGEEDLLELIKSHGGTFHVKSEGRMRAIARKRAPYAAQRLDSILEALMVFADTELDEEEERRLPLHTAIKFGEKDYLKVLLETMDQVDMNQLDSKERTAADFAALCGEEDLLELIKNHGGKFHVKSEPRMRAIARKQAPYAAQRLNSILEAL